jgi:hypothetical protein
VIEIRIHCDHADGPRAKEGKPSDWCVTASGGHDGCVGTHLNMDTAASLARSSAREIGWRQTTINKNGKRGWLCGPCYARAYGGK